MGESDIAIVLLSAKVASVAIIVALAPAFAVAWVLARGAFPGKGVLQAIVTLPLVLPPVATGYTLLSLFGTQGPLGHFFETVFGLTFAFRWTGAALAAGVMAFPLLVRPIRLSIEAVDQGLEEAARTLGASRIMTFLTVTLPLGRARHHRRRVCSASPRRWESSARQSPSYPTFRAKRRHCRWPSIPSCKARQAMRRRRRLIVISVAIAFAAILASEWVAQRFRRRKA